jgi:hypothetical protein
MAWKINGVEISETSKVNGITWVTGKKFNNTQLNICYYYDLTNNNPPFPPSPPLNFTYTDCFGSAQNISIGAGSPPQQICALVDSVGVPPGGSSNKGSRCTS